MAKSDFVLARCHGKDVLDCGMVDHLASRAVEGRWLHRKIREVAKSTVGLDFLVDGLRETRAATGITGFVAADAHRPPFKHSSFDVVVAGDLIEHLHNPGAFLEASLKTLREGGEIVLTTPNPFYINQFLTILQQDDVTVNTEHCLWLDPYTMRVLAERAGLEIVEFAWLADTWGAWTVKDWLGPPKRRLLRAALVPAWLLLRSVRSLRRVRGFLSSDFGVVLRAARRA